MGYAINNESADDSQLYRLCQLSAGRNVIKSSSLSVRNIDISYTKVTLNTISTNTLCFSLFRQFDPHIYNPIVSLFLGKKKVSAKDWIKADKKNSPQSLSEDSHIRVHYTKIVHSQEEIV